ncbi:MAG TPA: hypothetical protein VJC03_07345, partial [bacterium]|nr:hypothetical protein [bacterium]
TLLEKLDRKRMNQGELKFVWELIRYIAAKHGPESQEVFSRTRLHLKPGSGFLDLVGAYQAGMQYKPVIEIEQGVRVTREGLLIPVSPEMAVNLPASGFQAEYHAFLSRHVPLDLLAQLLQSVKGLPKAEQELVLAETADLLRSIQGREIYLLPLGPMESLRYGMLNEEIRRLKAQKPALSPEAAEGFVRLVIQVVNQSSTATAGLFQIADTQIKLFTPTGEIRQYLLTIRSFAENMLGRVGDLAEIGRVLLPVIMKTKTSLEFKETYIEPLLKFIDVLQRLNVPLKGTLEPLLKNIAGVSENHLQWQAYLLEAAAFLDETGVSGMDAGVLLVSVFTFFLEQHIAGKINLRKTPIRVYLNDLKPLLFKLRQKGTGLSFFGRLLTAVYLQSMAGAELMPGKYDEIVLQKFRGYIDALSGTETP